ncbi:hypothetical protein ABZV31_10725 [Streptomyces sp. NPDC005202]|uniref:hypothetical protein n=1 Tax=Streptomyces sp. NPDC005202 TaxID=3157021 RepID=UPI0033B7C1B6
MALRGRRTASRLAAVLPVSVAAVLCGIPATGAAADREPHADPANVALVVAGGSGRTSALCSGEPGFARLWQLLQPTYAGTEPVSEAWLQGRYPAVRVTVVWGLSGVGGWPQTHRAPGGDMAVERQDQLIVAEDGTPWVRTDPAPDVEDDDIRWHRAPRSVFGQLDRAGLLGGAGDTASGDGSGAADRAWWAAAGLAVAVGGTLLIRRAAARRGAGPPREERRQELIDL